MRTAILSLVFILVWICVPSAAQDTDLKTLIETGKYTEAEATAKRLLAKTPDAGRVRHQLAEALAQTGRYADAITEFERAATDLEKTNEIPGARLESDLRRAELLELIGQESTASSIKSLSNVASYSASAMLLLRAISSSISPSSRARSFWSLAVVAFAAASSTLKESR